ncbi:hypothetical protein I3760_06G117100 [Carya illinoinensis]|nr:hypothetical protein I3760_06G117100 [Carya illinoinensis]
MCIAAFLWQVHPSDIVSEVDEPKRPLELWEGGDILGGRDDVAGGTWLACSGDGPVAFLTNVREVQKLQEAKSRGDLLVRFLKAIVKEGNNFVTQVEPGIHVYTSVRLDSPWSKVEEMVENLMMNTVKDDESMLPRIFPQNGNTN